MAGRQIWDFFAACLAITHSFVKRDWSKNLIPPQIHLAQSHRYRMYIFCLRADLMQCLHSAVKITVIRNVKKTTYQWQPRLWITIPYCLLLSSFAKNLFSSKEDVFLSNLLKSSLHKQIIYFLSERQYSAAVSSNAMV